MRELFVPATHCLVMRACFLGQNICALGFGVATLQMTPVLVDEDTGEPARLDAPDKPVDQTGTSRPDRPPPGSANPL